MVSDIENFSLATRPSSGDFDHLYAELIGLSGVSVYVHGSRSDGRICAFSDFDDLIVYDSENEDFCEDGFERALQIVEKRIYKMDPLQHHGHFIIRKESLVHFSGLPLPIHLLGHVTCISGEEKITVSIDVKQVISNSRDGLMATIQGLSENQFFLEGEGVSLYRLKCFISGLALIPCLESQVKGGKKSKVEAIESVSQSSSVAGDCIRWSTKQRADWAQYLNWSFRIFAPMIRCLPVSSSKKWIQRVGPRLRAEDLSGSFPGTKIKEYLEKVSRTNALGFQPKTKENYDSGTERLKSCLSDEFSISGFGTFGDPSFPGISDLDVVVIVAEDCLIKPVQVRAQEIIESDANLKYLMEPHGVLVVSENSTEFLRKLHSLYNLDIDNKRIEVGAGDATRVKVIEVVWASYILKEVLKVVANPLSVSTRIKFLVGKNAAQAVDNLSSSHDDSSMVNESLEMRRKFLKTPAVFESSQLDDFLRRCLSGIAESLETFAGSHQISLIRGPLYDRDGSVWRKFSKAGVAVKKFSRGGYEFFVPKGILGLISVMSGLDRSPPPMWRDYIGDLREAYSFFRSQGAQFPFLPPPVFSFRAPSRGFGLSIQRIVRRVRAARMRGPASKLVPVYSDR